MLVMWLPGGHVYLPANVIQWAQLQWGCGRGRAVGVTRGVGVARGVGTFGYKGAIPAQC